MKKIFLKKKGKIVWVLHSIHCGATLSSYWPTVTAKGHKIKPWNPWHGWRWRKRPFRDSTRIKLFFLFLFSLFFFSNLPDLKLDMMTNRSCPCFLQPNTTILPFSHRLVFMVLHYFCHVTPCSYVLQCWCKYNVFFLLFVCSYSIL